MKLWGKYHKLCKIFFKKLQRKSGEIVRKKEIKWENVKLFKKGQKMLQKKS